MKYLRKSALNDRLELRIADWKPNPDLVIAGC